MQANEHPHTTNDNRTSIR